MEGVSEAFGQSFTYEFNGISVNLRAPSFSDFAYMESLIIQNEPPLQEQAAAIAQIAKVDTDWSEKVCRDLYQAAIDRRRKVTTEELVSFCFTDVIGHHELLWRLIKTQKPNGYLSLSKDMVLEKVADGLLNEDPRAIDASMRLAESSGVMENENPT